jgi:hypothetical protein
LERGAKLRGLKSLRIIIYYYSKGCMKDMFYPKFLGKGTYAKWSACSSRKTGVDLGACS